VKRKYQNRKRKTLINDSYRYILYTYVCVCDNTHTVTRTREHFFFRAHVYVVRARVCTVQSINASNPPESGKCTLYLYNNKYMRTCARLNTNSDRIPIQLIKMHVNGDSDFDDDGFCDYARYFRHHGRRLFSTDETSLRACAHTHSKRTLPEYYMIRS